MASGMISRKHWMEELGSVRSRYDGKRSGWKRSVQGAKKKRKWWLGVGEMNDRAGGELGTNCREAERSVNIVDKKMRRNNILMLSTGPWICCRKEARISEKRTRRAARDQIAHTKKATKTKMRKDNRKIYIFLAFCTTFVCAICSFCGTRHPTLLFR